MLRIPVPERGGGETRRDIMLEEFGQDGRLAVVGGCPQGIVQLEGGRRVFDTRQTVLVAALGGEGVVRLFLSVVREFLLAHRRAILEIPWEAVQGNIREEGHRRQPPVISVLLHVEVA